MLDDLWPLDDEAPWSAEIMLGILTYATLEGQRFSVEALAFAFDVDAELLSDSLCYLLDEPDDAGLVKEAPSVFLELKSADFRREIEMFQFSPRIGFYALERYAEFSPKKIKKLIEGLRKAYWPFVEKKAKIIADLLDLVGDAEEADRYRAMLSSNSYASVFLQLDLYLDAPDTLITLSRLEMLIDEIVQLGVLSNDSDWFSKRAYQLAVRADKYELKNFSAKLFYYAGIAYFHLGLYEQAEENYERALKIFEEIGRQSGQASCLNGLGDVASARGLYEQAEENYERALKINEEIGINEEVLSIESELKLLKKRKESDES